MTKTEQEIIFSRLKSALGDELALFCMCAVFDKPYETESDAETWAEYLSGKEKGDFSDGATDVNAAILAGMPTQERWERMWGEGYSESDYKQLDYYYSVMISQLDGRGGLDPQQKDAAMSGAKMRLNKDKLLLNYKDKDAISSAKQLDQMIRETLKDSNMRKADILPSAQQRPDGFVDALRKKYGLTMEMTKDDVMQAFFSWCASKHYPQTVDAEEHAMMAILRTMQKNDDLPEPTELPDAFDFGPYAAQFEVEPNGTEEEVYEYLGIVRGEYKKGDG